MTKDDRLDVIAYRVSIRAGSRRSTSASASASLADLPDARDAEAEQLARSELMSNMSGIYARRRAETA